MERAILIHSRRLWRCRSGVSAVEFALFAPILFFGLLATVDVGLALYERMTIDHILRAAAQSAMADHGEDEVRRVLMATASKNFTLSAAGDPDEEASLQFDVRRYEEDCAPDCAASAQPFAFYQLSAGKAYDGMFLPMPQLSSSMLVQVR